MLKLVLWGTGQIAEEVMNRCNTLNLYCILGFIDNDVSKIGTRFCGYEVFAPSEIEKINPDRIVVLTNSFDEIKNQIAEQYATYVGCVENKNFFYKESMLLRYCGNNNPEIKCAIDYIKNNGLDIFNYEFSKNYKDMTFEIAYDKLVGLYYVIHSGKRLYFSKAYSTEKKVSDYYKSILMEQDEKSPHRYFSNEFNVSEGDVVIDVGVAEGNFSLEIVDKVSKIYLIEADDYWIEALKITFKDYMDKVVIIKAFVSSYDEGQYRTLDSLIDEKVNFIKMDIEGNEWDGLIGAKRLIEDSDNLKLAICSYHSDFDQELIEKFMDEMSIEHSHTNGYMWFPWTVRQNYISTRLNRAIVRGVKCAKKQI